MLDNFEMGLPTFRFVKLDWEMHSVRSSAHVHSNGCDLQQINYITGVSRADGEFEFAVKLTCDQSDLNRAEIPTDQIAISACHYYRET